jgi:uncharacterized DUF497 family protein
MDLFEPNPAKAKTNLAKHGILFEEAQTVFLDDLSFRRKIPIILTMRNAKLFSVAHRSAIFLQSAT